jgi:hypothetical protein
LFSYAADGKKVYFLSGGKANSVSLQIHPRNRSGAILRKAAFFQDPGQCIIGSDMLQCPSILDGSEIFSQNDAYTEVFLGNMTVNGRDYEVTSTITYGNVVTPIEEFANQVLDFVSTPTGQTTLAAIAISTMLAQPEVAPFVFEAIEASGIFFETAATGASVTAIEATTATAAAQASAFQQAVKRGIAYEAEAVQTLGLVENTRKFSATIVTKGVSKAINVIPDAISVTGDRFIELKDQAYIAYEEQLRGEVAAALKEGKPLDLILGPATQYLTKPLMDGIRSTGGNILRYNNGKPIPYTQ